MLCAFPGASWPLHLMGRRQEHPSPHLLSIDSIYPCSGCSRRTSPASHGKTRLSMGRLRSHRLRPLPSPFSKFSTAQHGHTNGLKGQRGTDPSSTGGHVPSPPQHKDKLARALGQTGVRYPSGGQAGSSPSAFREPYAVALGSAGPHFRVFLPKRPRHAPFCPSGPVGDLKYGRQSSAGRGDGMGQQDTTSVAAEVHRGAAACPHCPKASEKARFKVAGAWFRG